MRKLLLKITVLIFFLFSTVTYSQTDFSHEVGVHFGPASFQTDFGQRGDFPSANASTLALGLTHYLKFFGSQYSWRSGGGYFASHFKLKTEFTYLFNTNIQHKGDLENRPEFQAMQGQIKMYNIGTSLEYYFLELEDYASFYGNENSFNPFVSIGLHFSSYDPDILVDGVSLENQQEPYTQLIPKWQENSIFLGSGNTFGLSIGAGLRYSLQQVDLVLDTRWQHFFSDNIDGLNAPNDPGNKRNDTMILVNVGIVYIFGKDK
ncbi:MAG: hypothetical protein L3J08_01270 [Flavobacteriaceae bacterium]|nr:hypothetical protein [Flavobacteriaceae bacterium]